MLENTTQTARRNRAIIKTAGINLAARIVSILVSLCQIPIALNYLKSEGFGLWMAMAGITQMMNFADLGLGLGLQNRFSAAYGRDDSREIVDLYTTGRRFLTAIGIALACACLPLCWILPLADWLNAVDPSLRNEVPFGLTALILAFCLGLPLNVGMRLAVGLQRGWLLGIWTAAGSIISLMLVIAASKANVGFGMFVLATVIAPIITNVGITFSILKILGQTYTQFTGKYLPHLCSQMYREGALFLTPQICATLMTSAPSVMIATLMGPADVTPFSLCQRLSGILIQFHGMPLAALWPAYAEARSRGDDKWISRTLHRSSQYAIITGVALGAAIWVCGDWLIRTWTGRTTPQLSGNLLLGFGLWTSCVCSMAGINVYLNGRGCLKGQAVGGVFSVVMMILLIPIALQNFGTVSVIYVMLLSCVICGWPWVLTDLYKNH